MLSHIKDTLCHWQFLLFISTNIVQIQINMPIDKAVVT